MIIINLAAEAPTPETLQSGGAASAGGAGGVAEGLWGMLATALATSSTLTTLSLAQCDLPDSGGVLFLTYGVSLGHGRAGGVPARWQ